MLDYAAYVTAQRSTRDLARSALPGAPWSRRPSRPRSSGGSAGAPRWRCTGSPTAWAPPEPG